MTKQHRPIRVTVALAVALALVTLVAVACSAPTSVGSTASVATDPGGGAATSTAKGANASSDYSRVLAALASMQAHPPSKPIVVLLGGSAARESTIDDGNWRRQIVAKGGPSVLAWNMGSSNRTMAQNVAIVKELPADAEAIVFIGVNLGSFTSAQKKASIKLPSPAPRKVSLYQPHRYSVNKGVKSNAKKKAMVRAWLKKRYPVFKRNFDNGAGVLEQLIRVCQTRGYKPVLLELPRDSKVIRSALNKPTKRFRNKCKALAAKYGIPFVNFVTTTTLPSKDYYDLWHLVEPGRTVWQKLLSTRTARLLEEYGYGNGGS